MTEQNIEPSVQASITFEEHGYQLDIAIDGQHQGSICRDFGGSYDIEDMSEFLADRLREVMKSFEKDFISRGSK